ncbi:MAG TPA: cytochrome c oxidase subunit 3 [Verrucomicrobiae bacterium]|nr:cytochrome c oxidase subunit 3 [Verrucomicrobiae bacterium]
MATIVRSQRASPGRRSSPSGNNRNRNGGSPGEPVYELHATAQLDPRGTPISAYRLITFLAIIWIVTLFVTLTLVLEWRWAHSTDWVSIPLPYVLYINTVILLGSSLTMEFARLSLRDDASEKCARWIRVTLLLGLVFLAGQLVAWRELVSGGLHLASNPGSFFFYLITGAHGLHLLGGIVALALVRRFVSRAAPRVKQQAAVDTIALYWHFMDGLWLYLLALLFIGIQR